MVILLKYIAWQNVTKTYKLLERKTILILGSGSEVEAVTEKPTAAFVLSLIGGIIILINGVLFAVAAAIVGSLAAFFMPAFGALALAIAVPGLIFGIIIIIGAALMHTTDPSKVKTGSILVLIFSILSIIIGGGFIIGLILGVVGGALGLAWKPSAPSAPSPAPAPSSLS